MLSAGAQNTGASLALRLGRVLVVGGGSMGRAICAGLRGPCGVDPSNVCVANPGRSKRETLEACYGVRTVASAAEGLPADTVILAVKPGVVAQVASEIAGAGLDGARVFSIAAGVSSARLAELFGDGVQIARIMPNTPLQCGAGVSGVSGGTGTSDETVGLARELFAACGTALIVDEGQQDVVTAISGSGPAYFEQVLETLARTGEQLGLPYEDSLELALGTMRGTALMLEQTRQPLAEAIQAVSSPGGTTVAALQAMREHGLDEALAAGVRAAFERSRELGA